MVKFADKILGRCGKPGTGMMLKKNNKMTFHQHECNKWKGHEDTTHVCYCGWRWKEK